MQVSAIFQIFWILSNWVIHTVQLLIKRLVKQLLKILLLFSSPILRQQGFVLPTTVLLLLVITLAVGSMTLRTMNRAGQVASDRQQRMIYNAATPTIDRAKAKLEFLFDPERDDRYPNGIPDQEHLKNMMLNDGSGGLNDRTVNDKDAYTFPDINGNYESEKAEKRIDIDGDGNKDNAWKYRIDLDGNGELNATVAYSIIFEKPSNGSRYELSNASDEAIEKRANALQVRHGPLSVPIRDEGCGGNGGGNTEEGDDGWSKPDQGGASVYKNFQINAFVWPDEPNTPVSTLEFHQDRRIDEGNKWGAWFRNDLEIFPGAEFNWNGAMHTEGNFLVGNTNFEGYLISSPASCYYSRENSEITVADRQKAEDDEAQKNFEGQILSAQTVTNSWNVRRDRSIFHLFNPSGNITNDYKKELNITNDSTFDGGNSAKPDDYLLDPVVLLTQDASKARGDVFADGDTDNDGNPAPGRAETWTKEASPFLNARRLYNQSEQTPSVDDSFRADNRYGPKPRVKGTLLPDGIHIGNPIKGDRLLAEAGLKDEDLLRLGAAFGDEANDFNNVGLDGYWERRARAEGARVIVGQRLELGNSFGWGGGVNQDSDYFDEIDQEPLMPWNGCDEYGDDRCSESRQRRTLRDNLAAVQAAAVYHANARVSNANADFPVACLASTIHPGTPQTLQDSATFLDWTKELESAWDVNDFDGISDPDDLLLISDFLRGEGTNGWEYETPSGGSSSTFAADIGATRPLGRALRNLAHFAGDPFGGAPSFTPTQDDLVHPYPLLAMWGDFSVLRNIFDQELDSGVSYHDLSPADKTTLQTAACSLGMLANELYYLEKFDYTKIPNATRYGGSASDTLLDVLEARLYALSVDKNTTNYNVAYTGNAYWVEPPLNQTSGTYRYYQKATTFDTRFDGLGNAAPEAYIARLEQWRDADLIAFENPNVSASERLQRFNVDDDLINLAKIILLREQVLRDRTRGFRRDKYSPNCDGLDSDAYGPRYIFRDRGLDTIHDALCSGQPKFGALYSIFPGEKEVGSGAEDHVINTKDNHGEIEELSRGLESSETNTIKTRLNSGYTYSAFSADDLEAIRLEPRQPNDWTLPQGGLGTIDDYPYKGHKVNPNSSSGLFVTCNVELCSSGTNTSSGYQNTLYQTQTLQVALKDASLYDGREYLSVRVMGVDIDLLRRSNTGLVSADRWLPNSGIFYAFREDAVREDAITRPKREDWEDCNADYAYVSGSSDCHMGDLNLAAEEGTDPPLSEKSISPKPVDYHPDPDRRPYGFRFLNGARLSRPNDEGRGLSFVSDNAVYIQGDFNLHQNSAGTTLEEFSDYLLFTETTSNFGKFYDRRVRNSQFATIAGDEWRPSEILADAITILSDNFCDGSMFDSFQSVQRNAWNGIHVDVSSGGERKMKVMDGGTLKVIQFPWRSLYNCVDPPGNLDQTSYTNGVFPNAYVTGANKRSKVNSPSGLEEYWHHENPYDTTSPFSLTRQGNPRNPQDASVYQGRYYMIGSNSPGKRPGVATNTSVNAILISGSVPSRAGQSYGGLHNFPRFLENWRNKGLRIAGSLMQLSFSHASTGPYDHDSWEPATDADDTQEVIDYYSAPKRLWGYDVGLQKGVAGPMARRFTSGAEPVRSEFYSEPPADDQYIRNLCNAIPRDDMPSIVDRPCP